MHNLWGEKSVWMKFERFAEVFQIYREGWLNVGRKTYTIATYCRISLLLLSTLEIEKSEILISAIIFEALGFEIDYIV